MSGVSYGLSAQVQELSETMFGQRHRLALMAAIAQSDDGIVNPSELAEILGFRAQSSIQMPLKRLVDAGLLTRIPGIERPGVLPPRRQPRLGVRTRARRTRAKVRGNRGRA